MMPRRRTGGANPAHLENGAPTGVPGNVRYRIGKLVAAVPVEGRWLDCGCGDGAYSRAIRDAGATVVGVEIEPKRLARATDAEDGIEYHLITGAPLPFADDTFDGVWLNEVLEHVADETETLGDLRRVLRPGGCLVVMSPNRFFPFEGHGMQLGGRKVNLPIPLLPWVPSALSRRVMRARNYWPGELADLIARNGYEIVHTESVMPVFEVFPWLPASVARWYRAHVGTFERVPVISRMGVSTMVVARVPIR